MAMEVLPPQGLAQFDLICDLNILVMLKRALVSIRSDFGFTCRSAMSIPEAGIGPPGVLYPEIGIGIQTGADSTGFV